MATTFRDVINLDALGTFLGKCRAEFAAKASVPTKLSQLDNDAGYARGSDIPAQPRTVAELPD